MDARGLQIPSQVNVVKGDKSRQLNRMAYAYYPQRVKVLPIKHINSHRIFKPVKEERAVHQDKAKAKAAGGGQHEHLTRPENQRRVHQGL